MFNAADRLKALAIVGIFETSRPFGDPATLVVLDDGAGISYGIGQFTHRSGSLYRVVESYLASGGVVGKEVIAARLPLLRDLSPGVVLACSRDARLKAALRLAARTPEMLDAQGQVMEHLYLRPALAECARLGFSLPLSLAVVYDSFIHGSWPRLRDAVPAAAPGPDAERAWITRYVARRDTWLGSIPRLAKTRYRTRFFLDQIAASNWQLDLPLRVHGVRLDDAVLARFSHPGLAAAPVALVRTVTASAVGPASPHTAEPCFPECGPAPSSSPSSLSNVCRCTRHLSLPYPPHNGPNPPDLSGSTVIDRIEHGVDRVAARYDQAERIVTTVLTRTDSAKSLWTTVLGTLGQVFWAVGSFLSGIPRDIWLATALTALAITLLYLHRQITLGKIRETQNHPA